MGVWFWLIAGGVQCCWIPLGFLQTGESDDAVAEAVESDEEDNLSVFEVFAPAEENESNEAYVSFAPYGDAFSCVPMLDCTALSCNACNA